MAQPSVPPPPPTSGGNLKYVIVGVLLLAGTGGLWMLIQSDAEPPPAPKPKPKPTVERSTSLATQDLLVDEPEEPEPEPEEAPEPEPKPKPRAKRRGPGRWDCSGDLEPSALRSIVAQNRPQVRTCYEKRLKVNNILQGSLNVRLKIGADGRVTTSRVGGTLQDEQVSACVRRLAQQWKFPAPGGGNCAVIEVPFNFTPKN